MSLLPSIHSLKKRVFLAREFKNWKARNYGDNSPHIVKQGVLKRYGNPNGVWVETGTYLGDTSKFLSGLSKKVYTIEPEPKLHARAAEKFKNTNIEAIHGTSEAVFPKLLPTIEKDVNFWLDGHFSAGVTFQGEKDCPIEDELKCIAKHLNRFNDVRIFIDDIRCFNDGFTAPLPDYPSLDALVIWSQSNEFSWKIEHDILIMKRNM